MNPGDRVVFRRWASLTLVAPGKPRTRIVEQGERGYLLDVGRDQMGNPVAMIELGNEDLSIAPLDLFMVCPSQVVK